MDKLENSKKEIIEPRPELILSSSEIKNFEPMDLVSVSGEKLTNFKNESRSILESANLNIGLSAEKIDKIQNESGVKDELKAIDDEAEKFVQAKIANTKTELNSKDKIVSYEDDSRYKELLNKEAYSRLKNYDSEYFNKNYSGLSDRGYLLDLNGKETNSQPIMNIGSKTGDLKYSEFINITKNKFFKLYPDAEKMENERIESLKPKSANNKDEKVIKVDNAINEIPVPNKAVEVSNTENKNNIETKSTDNKVENTENVKVAENKAVEEKEKEEEELPYSKDFIKNIQNLYFQEQSRLEDLGVSGQTLQVRLGEYKKRILEPMLEKESEENEALNKNEANITEENDSSIKQEDQVSKDNSEGNSQIDAVGDDNEEMSEKKSNKTEGIVKKVSYEEWTKTLNPKLLPNAKEYENLSPTYFVDDKNNHFVAFNEGGKKMVDKLYLNENNRVYVMPVDPLSIENK